MVLTKSLIFAFILKMGGEESKDSTPDDYYLLDHLSKMSLQNRKTVSYYFISPDQSSEFTKLLNELRQYFKLEHFPTIKTLKQEMSFVGKLELVKVIVTHIISKQDLAYLQNQSKISQLIAYGNTLEGKKIMGAATSAQQLIKLLNSLQEKDGLQIPASNVLFMIDQDTKILNKYRLNYHCNTTFNDRAVAKRDFIQLARALAPQQSAIIDQFEQNYNLQLQGEPKRKMILEWAFKNSFYWQLLSGVTRTTTDPKRLSYLRLLIKDLYESIREQYRVNRLFEAFYIVVELNQEEKSKLEKLQKAMVADQREKNFMIFSTFMKGTVEEKECVKMHKANPNNYRFLVNIYKKESAQNLDFGYVKSGSQVIVNIYNVFQIDSINNKTRRNQLLYGVLPIMDKCRQEENGRVKMTKSQLNLTRNYDYLEDLMGKIDSQATVLQLSGYFKESLEIYDKKVDFIRRSNDSDETMNRCLIKKADALTLNGEYEAAEKEYLAVSSKSQKIKAISLIHLTELYTRLGQDAKVDKTVDDFQPYLSILEKDQKEAEEFFKGSHFLALRTLKKGSARKAEEMLEKILNSASVYYKHNLEGKPIVHDLYRSLAASKSKQGRHNQALKLLNETRSLQLVCEGKTHNLAVTQTLIQSVSRSSGNQDELSKSLQRMQQLSTQIGASERRLQSSAMVSLNQSMVKIDV